MTVCRLDGASPLVRRGNQSMVPPWAAARPLILQKDCGAAAHGGIVFLRKKK